MSVEETGSAGAPPGVSTYTLPDSAGEPRKRFSGALLAHVSTGGGVAPRWLSLDLYRKADSDVFVLHRTGHSVVYHALPGGCEGGESMTFTEIVDEVEEGEPCSTCKPPRFRAIKEAVRRNLGDSGTVALERTYYKVLELHDVPTLVEALKFTPRNSRTGVRVVSRPAQELLLRAAEHDGRIAALFDLVEDI